MVDLMDLRWMCLRLNLPVAHHGLDVLWGTEAARDAVVHSHGVLIRGCLWLHRQLRSTSRCGRPYGLRAEPVRQMAGGASALCILAP